MKNVAVLLRALPASRERGGRLAGRTGPANLEVTGENRRPPPVPPEGTGQLVLYRTEDGRTRISCRVEDDSVWLQIRTLREYAARRGWAIALQVKVVATRERRIFQPGKVEQRVECLK